MTEQVEFQPARRRRCRRVHHFFSANERLCIKQIYFQAGCSAEQTSQRLDNYVSARQITRWAKAGYWNEEYESYRRRSFFESQELVESQFGELLDDCKQKPILIAGLTIVEHLEHLTTRAIELYRLNPNKWKEIIDTLRFIAEERMRLFEVIASLKQDKEGHFAFFFRTPERSAQVPKFEQRVGGLHREVLPAQTSETNADRES